MSTVDSSAQTDYKLWLQYEKVQDAKLVSEYQSTINGIVALDNSETIQAATKELQLGLSGLLGNKINVHRKSDNKVLKNKYYSPADLKSIIEK